MSHHIIQTASNLHPHALTLAEPNAYTLRLQNTRHYQYQAEYYTAQQFEDVSFGRFSDANSGIAVFCTIASAAAEDAPTVLNNWGDEVLVIAKNDGIVRRSVTAHFLKLLAAHGINQFRLQDVLIDGSLSAFAAYFLQDLQWQVAVSNFYESVIVLSDDASVWQNIRKSYRPLIKSALTKWTHNLYSGPSAKRADFDAFQALHFSLAGKQTRSQATWDLQWDAIVAGASFVVEARDEAGELVGASLFSGMHTGVCQYSSSVAKRELFGQPVNHGIMWLALQQCIKLGIPSFHMGQTYADSSAPMTPKMQNIAKFKSGFGGAIKMSVFMDVKRSNGE